MSYILNTFPGAFAAYSLRKLKTGTLDSIILIQRESDNETLPIGFSSDGFLDTTSITNFCIGTTCRVTELKDQVGTAHLYQSTLANAPVIYENGALIVNNANKVALKFSPNQRLISTNTYTANALRDFSYFLVHAHTGSYSNNSTIVSLPEADIRRTAAATYTLTGAFNAINNITTINSNVPRGIFAVRDGSLKVTRLGVGGQQAAMNDTFTPQTSARNIIIGSNQNGAEYASILFHELVYYRANRVDIRNEFETQTSYFYTHIDKNRSKLDTIADSFDKPLIGYSLRIIGAEKMHPIVNNLNYTSNQFTTSSITPLIRIRRGTSQSHNSGETAEVYPDIYGEISLNSKVILVTGTITFSKPIHTLGEFLGNPYYSSAVATHYNGYVERWYEQFISSYTNSASEGYLNQTTLQLQPIIYLNNSGLVKLNNKPAIKFDGAHKLVAQLSTTYVGHPFLNSSTTITGSNSGFIVNAVLGIISSSGAPSSAVSYRNAATQNILNIAHDVTTNKFSSTITNTTGNIFTDASKNTILLNTQYLVSVVRNKSRFYITADGSSDTKQTVSGTMQDSANNTTNTLVVGDAADTGSGLQFYIQELSNFKRNGEAYKLDIEEEIKRHYDITTLNSNLNLIAVKYASSLSLAYALRKISSASSNHLISIRRSDGVETNVFADIEGRISYDSSISSTTYKNLGEFAAGYDCYVTKLVDQMNTTSNRDMTQVTATFQPQIYSATDGLILFNGLPAMRFDGVDDRLNVSNSAGVPTANCSVISTSSSSGNGILFSGINTEISNATNRIVELRYGVTSGNWGFSVASSPAFTHTPIVMQANSASAHHIGIANYHTSGGYASAIAGGELNSNTGAITINQQINAFSIGYVPTGATTGTDFFNGFVQEILLGTGQEANKVDIVEITNDYYKVF